jgi:hemolysin-activating ACP:hemolysin acyltransferase
MPSGRSPGRSAKLSKLPDSVTDLTIDRSVQLGFALEIFWCSGMQAHQGWIIPAHILPAIQLDQIMFAFDQAGLPVGLVSWAYLADDVHNALLVDAWRPLHISEWNEGSNLWIMTLLAKRGSAYFTFRSALRGGLGTRVAIHGYERAPDGQPAKLRTFCGHAGRAGLVGS